MSKTVSCGRVSGFAWQRRSCLDRPGTFRLPSTIQRCRRATCKVAQRRRRLFFPGKTRSEGRTRRCASTRNRAPTGVGARGWTGHKLAKDEDWRVGWQAITPANAGMSSPQHSRQPIEHAQPNHRPGGHQWAEGVILGSTGVMVRARKANSEPGTQNAEFPCPTAISRRRTCSPRSLQIPSQFRCAARNFLWLQRKANASPAPAGSA